MSAALLRPARAPRATRIGAAALLLCAGCAGARGSSPRGTLERFVQAAQRNDDAALYELLPQQARRAETLAQFRARLASERDELGAVATAVEQTLATERGPTAELVTSDGSGATVVEDERGWRLARAGLGPAATPTPADAARALRVAVRRRDLDGLLQVLSARARGAVLADLAALDEALRDPAELQAVATSSAGDGVQRLEYRLPDGRVLVLVREGGSWRIDDLE